MRRLQSPWYAIGGTRRQKVGPIVADQGECGVVVGGALFFGRLLSSPTACWESQFHKDIRS